ncbi:hypothetical protein [Escherichia coli]|uniref:hypothetical protein n=1 Tax=Escherichia coli TaxID=562 RepID=UPI00226451F8|nr:hypothetical protein [Escherichia coli]
MLFDQNDWKLSVTDIDLYANTCKLDGQSYPLSFALKTLIPGYVSGFSPRQAAPLEVLEVLAEAGVPIVNFFGKDLMSAYRLRQQAKIKAQAEAAEIVRIQAERMAELNMTPEERLAAAQKRDQQKAERQAYGDSIRNAVSSTGRSRASKLVEIEGMDNWMDSL